MANVLAELFGGIADAIREKNGTTAAMKPTAFADAIRGIETDGSSADVRYVTFVSYDGSIEYGIKPVAVGDDCADPFERGLFDTPTRQTDDQYTYTFTGWATEPGGGVDENALSTVTEDRVLYAVFSAAVRYYTITYYDYDGSTVLKTQSLAYGTTPSYAPAKTGYTFTGWVPTPVPVTGDASYSAQWIEKLDFGALTWAQIAQYAQQEDVASLFDLGATKTFTLKSVGTTVTARIIGFNHDQLADGSGTAGITLFLEGFWNKYTDLHGTGTAAQKAVVWKDMEFRKYTPTKLTYLPDDLYAVLKTVKKTTYDLANGAFTESEDTAFIPSAQEVNTLAWFYGYPSGEGPTYAYFSDDAKRVMKYDGTAVPWWTRTKANASTGLMAVINASGVLATASQSNVSNGGYPFMCVCI